MTSFTINPLLAGRVPTDEVTSITREGAADVGASVERGAIAAVASGEGAALGLGVDVDGRRVVLAMESDAEGSGEPVTVGSEADGNGDPVAIGSDAVGSGRIVAIGTDAEGSGTMVATGREADGSGGSSGSEKWTVPGGSLRAEATPTAEAQV